MIVPRTVTAVGSDDKPARTGAKLSDFRDERFYVLLGSPGAGKTTAFEAEALRSDESLYLTAREVARAHSHPKSKWRGKTLFIDGLDEVRAGKQDVREPLDSILDCLDRLGGPPARLSCRSAAWLATNDREAIRSIPGYGRLTILQLDPLTEENARDILGHRLGSAALDFFESANSRMLHGLLDNPLTLELLMKATGEGCEWPASRVDTFERACLALTTEENDEHRAALRYPTVRENLSPTRVLDAASRIAALYLLTDKDGIAWDRSDAADPDSVLLINEAINPDGDWTRKAWESGLLVPKRPTPGVHLPVHEHVAEYLAARHLKKAVAGRAVLRRVIGLLTAGGGVPSPLRGVAAWLAALCPDARKLLIDLDPVAIVAYGDIGVFDEDERTHLLDRLSMHAGPSSNPWRLPNTALVGLVNSGTMNDLFGYMVGSDRSDDVQKTMTLLLRGVAAIPLQCDQISGKDLLATARDPTWSLSVRHSALAAAIKLPSNPEEITTRLQLLQDVNEGSVDDPSGNIQMWLFRNLYPDHIPPDEAWRWVPMPFPRTLAPVLPRRLSPERCRELLDALHTRSAKADYVWDWSLAYLTWELLARVIEAHGESLGVTELYDWIKLAAYDPATRMWDRSHGDADRLKQTLLAADVPGGPDRVLPGAPRVQVWLAERPSIQKELLRLHLLPPTRGEDGRDHDARIFGATAFWKIVSCAGRPADFRQWCLRKALAVAGTDEDVAHWLVSFAVQPIRRSMPAGEWLPTALELVGNAAILADQLKAMAEHDRIAKDRELAYSTRRTDQKRQLAGQVLQHRNALLAGTGPEELLVELGQVYCGGFGGAPADGEERLRAELASSDDATDVALNALVRAATSDAGPKIPEIVKLDGEGKFFGWCMPFLAGLDVMERRGEHIPSVLGEGLERAVWFFLAKPLDDRSEMPAWFADVLESRAKMVASILAELHRNRIRAKWDNSALLYKMTMDERYRHAARLALPDLLKAFPAKGYGAQLPLLHQVLVAAIRHVPEDVAPRVRNRMAIRNMNAAQRITWLGAGVAVAPDEFALDAVAFIEEGRDARRKHLENILYAVSEARGNKPLFDVATEAEATAVALLVNTLGRKHLPYWSVFKIQTAEKARIVDDAITLVKHMIECLAKNPTRVASLELDCLSNDRNLTNWHSALKDALERQKALHYRTERRIPAVEEVEEVLRDGPPANAADLAALIVDRLERLGRDIRHSSTDDWQEYWQTERRPPSPQDEDYCRNRLLSALRWRLPDGVDVRREASYADNTRADIRVCFDSHAIPIEIKKSSNRELWSAMRNQLMKKYVRDPESAGHGIYVVLWFGAGGAERVKTPPKGPRPKDPEELARRLEEELSDDERHRVKVVVIDVSRPEST